MTVIKRFNNAFGTTTDSPLGSTATTMNSQELPRLGVVDSANNEIARLTLDPERNDGAPEIIHVTDYDGTATSATIERGKEGTSQREHASGTTWEHAPTVEDVDLALSDDFALDGDAPSNYPTGHSTFTDAQGSFPAGAGGIVETINPVGSANLRQCNWIGGTNTIYTRVATDSTAWEAWLRTNHVPVALMHLSTDQSINNDTTTKVNLDTVDYDRGGIADATNNQMVLVDGLWVVTTNVRYVSNATGTRRNQIERGMERMQRTEIQASSNPSVPAASIIESADGKALELFAWQNSGGSLNVDSAVDFTFMQAFYLEER